MKKVIQVILLVAVLYHVLAFLISLLSHSGGSSYTFTYTASCDEYALKDDYTQDYNHNREWHLPRQYDSHCMGFRTLNTVYLEEESERDGLIHRIDDYDNYWGEVYDELVQQTGHALDFIADSLVNEAAKTGMDEMDLARLAVSFVQDIPYSYILSGDCADRETNGKPCIGNIPLGIISPYEFLHSLKGDCDTRAVLLYVLLDYLGYDPMVVVSDEYAHAMLALNVPAQGDYMAYKGKKYYFWETTATGWQIGMLPPESNNKNYWKIALVDES